MLTKIERGSVPLAGQASGMGVLPEHFNKNDVTVTYTDGTIGNTCHVSTNGQYFSLTNLIGGPVKWNAVVFDQISYVDKNGDVAIYDIPEHKAVEITDQKVFTLGYVSKINDLRWGFNLNIESGRGQLVVDQGSPIIGVGFHFTNV